jgi:hypothetical protein
MNRPIKNIEYSSFHYIHKHPSFLENFIFWIKIYYKEKHISRTPYYLAKYDISTIFRECYKKTGLGKHFIDLYKNNTVIIQNENYLLIIKKIDLGNNTFI